MQRVSNALRWIADPVSHLKGKLEMNLWADLNFMVGNESTADQVIVSTPQEKGYELSLRLLQSIEAKCWLLEKP